MRFVPLVALAFLFACSSADDKQQPDAGVTGCQSAADCDDSDACTTDTCGTNHMCEHAAKTVDDSISCTTDACNPATGEVTHTPVNTMCDDNATCSTDSCDPTATGADATTGCVHTLNNNAC